MARGQKKHSFFNIKWATALFDFKKHPIIASTSTVFVLLLFIGALSGTPTDTQMAQTTPMATITSAPASGGSRENINSSSPNINEFAETEPSEASETPANTIKPQDSTSEAIKPSETPTLNTKNGKLSIHFIDVGQADSILIEQGTHAMLIDAGNNDDSDLVVNYIKSEGISKLDYTIGTHPHEDHIGGMDAVINNFSIDKLIMPKVSSNTKTFEDVLTAVQKKGLKVTTPMPGTKYSFGDAEFTILAPNNSSYEDLNNYSVVIKLVYGQTSFLLTGDAESISEGEMLSKGYDLKADVLKVGHHGSTSSSSNNFLDAVNPNYAVINVGLNNDYGHPAPETLQKIKDHGIQVYRTDENGTITVTSDGKNIIFTESKEAISQDDTDTNIDNKELATPLPTPVATPSPTPTATPSQSATAQPLMGSVEIINVDLKGELVTIKNTSTQDVDISGWKLVSVTGNQSFSFPNGCIIKPGATLTIASGDASGDIKWTNKNIWNNDGDPAQLYNSDGKLVSED